MNKFFPSMILALLTFTTSFAQYYNGEQVGAKYVYERVDMLGNKSTDISEVVEVIGNTVTVDTTTELARNDEGEPESMVVMMTYALGKKAICTGYDDLENMLKVMFNSLAEGREMKIVSKGDSIYIPLQGKIGDKLHLSHTNIEASLRGRSISLDTNTTKREVVREEKITTPMGTFDTFVVEEESTMKLTTMGDEEVFENKNTYWIVPDKGLIKSVMSSGDESYTTTLIGVKKA